MKNQRQKRIIELIAEKEISTQEELADALRDEGLNVTQATVSRDIKDLRLIKVPSDSGGYRYASVTNSDNNITDKLYRMFSSSVISVESAVNIIVVRTLSGSANAAAMVIDALKLPAILGSVAGDDTILLVISNTEQVQGIVQRLRGMMKQ